MLSRRALILAAASTPVIAAAEGVSPSKPASVNRAYLQQLADSGRPVIVPNRRIEIDGPIRLSDGAAWSGEGPDAQVHNVDRSGRPGWGLVFDYGNIMVGQFLEEPSWEVERLRGTELITDAPLEPGDVIWAYSSAKGSDGLAAVLQFNEVVSVGPVMRVRHPWIDIPNPRVSKSSGRLRDPLGNVRRATKDVSLRRMRISTADQTGWDAAGGSLRGVFEDLTIDSLSPIYSNGFAYCRFNNIRGTFAGRVVELAGYSHDTVIEGLDVRFKSRGVPPKNDPLISFGENSNRNRLSDFRIYADSSPQAYLVRALSGSDNVVERGVAHVRGLRSAVLAVTPSGGRCHDNVVRDVEIYAGRPAALVDWGGSAKASEAGNRLERVRFFDDGRAQRLRVKPGARPDLRDVTVNGKPL